VDTLTLALPLPDAGDTLSHDAFAIVCNFFKLLIRNHPFRVRANLEIRTEIIVLCEPYNIWEYVEAGTNACTAYTGCKHLMAMPCHFCRYADRLDDSALQSITHDVGDDGVTYDGEAWRLPRY
jgi:hypothetical protein